MFMSFAIVNGFLSDTLFTSR
jgi:alkanesulfonate monooxygenase SsuD/methylene tetrahydromethanopterin reductase-like flavin-dependent oxidoreductase (luciferase family)